MTYDIILTPNSKNRSKSQRKKIESTVFNSNKTSNYSYSILISIGISAIMIIIG